MDPLWAELINSDWRDYRGTGAREDRIGNEEWLRRFLARTGWDKDRLPRADERKALRRLRGLLRGMVDAIRKSGKIPPRLLLELNGVLDSSPVVYHLEVCEGQPSLLVAPKVGGVERVMGEVAASFAAMLADGEPERIKVCANPDCGWVIYDGSRNRSRRWCDKTECGNLIKVRQHRQRKRVEAARPKA
jgi:predicted RNA-binding Zn ribbon-like protein